MPRTRIPISLQVDHLSILDENGRLDEALEPKIGDDLLLRLHSAMLLSRRFDQRLLNLQRQGRIGTFPPTTGQEAAHIGAVAALRASDWMTPSFREVGAEIWRGRSLESVLLYSAGYAEGIHIQEDRNDLPISIPVGSQTLHALGIGWAAKYRGTDDVAMAFFGDGATSQGDFHEALNMAGVYRAPVVFVCQNNHWAISVPLAKQTRSQTIAQKALAYGFPGIQVDGNDVLAVYAAASEAVERARAGEGPTLIECVTYRLMMHTTADDPKRYRSDEEVAAWEKRDPLPRFQGYLRAKGLLSGGSLDRLEQEIERQIQDAVEHAERMMEGLGDPLDMFEHVYADLPGTLAEQKDLLARELAAAQKEVTRG